MSSHKEELRVEELRQENKGKGRHRRQRSISAPEASSLNAMPSTSFLVGMSSSSSFTTNEMAEVHLHQVALLHTVEISTAERKLRIAEHYDLAFEAKPTDIGILSKILGHYVQSDDAEKQQMVLDHIIDVLSPNKNPAELIDKANCLPYSVLYPNKIIQACYDAALGMQPEDIRLLDHIIGYFIEKNQLPKAKLAIAHREALVLGNASDQATEQANIDAKMLILQGQQRLFGENDTEIANTHYRVALQEKPNDILLLRDIALHFIQYQEVKSEDILLEGFDYLPPAKKALLLIKVAEKLPEDSLENRDRMYEAAFHLGNESLTVLDKVLGYHLKKGEHDKADVVIRHIIDHFPGVQNRGDSHRRAEQLESMARILPDNLTNRDYIKHAYYRTVLGLKPYDHDMLYRMTSYFYNHANCNSSEAPTEEQKQDLRYAITTADRAINMASSSDEVLKGYLSKINYLRMAEDYEAAKRTTQKAEVYIASVDATFSPRLTSIFYLVKGHIFFDQALKHAPDVQLENMSEEQRGLLREAEECYTQSWKADPTHADAFKFAAAAHHNLRQEGFSAVARTVQELLDTDQTVDSIHKKASEARYFPVKRFAYSLILDKNPTDEQAFYGLTLYQCQTSLRTNRANRIAEWWDKLSYGNDLDQNPVDEVAFKRYCEIADLGEVAWRTFNALAHNPDFELAKEQLAQLHRAIPLLNQRSWNALAEDPSFLPALQLLETVDRLAFPSPVPNMPSPPSCLTTLSLPMRQAHGDKETQHCRIPSLSELILRGVFKDKELYKEFVSGNPVMSTALASVVRQQEGKQWQLRITSALDERTGAREGVIR